MKDAGRRVRFPCPQVSMNSRSIVIESGLFACAVGLAWFALFYALRSGALSAANRLHASEMGGAIYIICRAISLTPIAAGWSQYLKFSASALAGAGFFYLLIVWMNAIT